MYVLKLPSLFFYFDFKRIFISSNVAHTVIPFPRFVTYPGFTIQIFFKSVFLFRILSSLIILYLSRNSRNSGSYNPPLIWKVRGIKLKGSNPLTL